VVDEAVLVTVVVVVLMIIINITNKMHNEMERRIFRSNGDDARVRCRKLHKEKLPEVMIIMSVG
jgi:hypothetical protein